MISIRSSRRCAIGTWRRCRCWSAHEPISRGGARAALGLPQQGLCIGWAGRLSAEKGPDLMLEALALLNDEPVRLSMLGDGAGVAGRERLRARAEALGVAHRITWHGLVPEAA